MSTSARRAESRSVAIIEDLATRRDGAKRKIIGPIELAALINFTTSGPLNLFSFCREVRGTAILYWRFGGEGL